MGRAALVLLISYTFCVAQPAGNWLDRQKASVAKQIASVGRLTGTAQTPASIQKQTNSAARQRDRAVPVSHWEWSPAAKAILEVSPISLSCIPSGLSTYDALIERNARQSGISDELLRAVIRKESGFDACAVSRAGAKGLMQLMPETAEWLGVEDPFNPEQNVRGGSRFLKFLIDRYGGNLPLALGAYNAGPGRVDRLGRVPAIAETQDYVRTILGALNGAPAVIE